MRWTRLDKALAAAGAAAMLGGGGYLLAGGGSDGSGYGSPREISDALGCSSSYDEESGAVAPADVATCHYSGEQVTLVVGDTADQRDETVTMAVRLGRQFGVKRVVAVVGDRWAVLTGSAGVARDAQSQVGGSIR